jgi:Bacteriophage replication gene A protein (GPA)
LEKKALKTVNQMSLNLLAPDEALIEFSENTARDLKSNFIYFQSLNSPDYAAKWVEREIGQLGFTFPIKKPLLKRDPEKAYAQALARCFDPDWWLRIIRIKKSRAIEHTNIELGLVNKDEGLNVSQEIFCEKQKQWKRNRIALEMMEIENEQGEVFSLDEVVDKSVSNPSNRRNELMVRLCGFEQVANEREDSGVFYTITAPSKYHAFRSNPCIPNEKYEGATPIDTQAYLNTVWRRIRAKLAREKIDYYGFRVAEPHHDGTPHWHMLLFAPPGQVSQLSNIIRHYALMEDGDEPGAKIYHFKAEVIDKNKGSATSYIAKYISKNIDGLGLDTDINHHDAKNAALRIRAWASVWGIRQFQQVGGPPVTPYRELRKLRNDIEFLEQRLECAGLHKIYDAADTGNWGDYIKLNGGPIGKRKDQILRAYHVLKNEVNRYGEEVKSLLGLLYNKVQKVITRKHRWIIRRKPFSEDLKPSYGHYVSSGGANAPPWSSVNNCTQLNY